MLFIVFELRDESDCMLEDRVFVFFIVGNNFSEFVNVFIDCFMMFFFNCNDLLVISYVLFRIMKYIFFMIIFFYFVLFFGVDCWFLSVWLVCIMRCLVM